jgi:1-acyl-sn-glycerol-3-phosphate acyltransferase
MASYSKWSAILARLYRWLWIGRIHSTPPKFPGAALVFAAHYNGAIDGFTYGSQLPSFLGVISAQWHRLPFGRWMFPGIALVRAKDGGKGMGNASAFRRIVAFLREGGRVLYFPEGTSRLGTQRLPVRHGTLLLLKQLREKEWNTPVYFSAAQYQHPTLWRSAIGIGWIGPLSIPTSPHEDEAWVRENLLKAQSIAYASALPPSRRWVWLGAIAACFYLPVWGITSTLAHRIADEENVIALWKFLLGVPATLVAVLAYSVLASSIGWAWWLPLATLVMGNLLWMA